MTKEESGQKLTELADARGLSGYGIAAALKVSHTTAYGWLNGKYKPGRKFVPALARLLEVPMQEISDTVASLTEEQKDELDERVLSIALAALEKGDLAEATEEHLDGPSSWSAEERAAIAALSPARLKLLLDHLAGEEFLALPHHRQLAVIHRFFAEERPPPP